MILFVQIVDSGKSERWNRDRLGNRFKSDIFMLLSWRIIQRNRNKKSGFISCISSNKRINCSLSPWTIICSMVSSTPDVSTIKSSIYFWTSLLVRIFCSLKPSSEESSNSPLSPWLFFSVQDDWDFRLIHLQYGFKTNYRFQISLNRLMDESHSGKHDVFSVNATAVCPLFLAACMICSIVSVDSSNV